MNDLKKEIEMIITELEAIVEMFYQQKTQDAYLKLDSALEKIMTMTGSVQNYQENYPTKTINMEDLLNALKETLEAMEEKDAILVADTLKYEVVEKLNDIAAQID